MQAHVIALFLHYKYFALLPIAIVEGPLITMISGFFLKLGYLSFLPAYLLLVAGDFMGDIIWYGVGYYFGHGFIRKFGKFFSVDEKSVATIERVFHKHQTYILFISKITMGFGFALVTLITAGMVRIPFKKYVLLNGLGEFIWTGILMSVGYLFGNFYVQINNTLGKISIIALFVVAFAALIGFGKYIKSRTTKTYSS